MNVRSASTGCRNGSCICNGAVRAPRSGRRPTRPRPKPGPAGCGLLCDSIEPACFARMIVSEGTTFNPEPSEPRPRLGGAVGAPKVCSCRSSAPFPVRRRGVALDRGERRDEALGREAGARLAACLGEPCATRCSTLSAPADAISGFGERSAVMCSLIRSTEPVERVDGCSALEETSGPCCLQGRCRGPAMPVSGPTPVEPLSASRVKRADLYAGSRSELLHALVRNDGQQMVSTFSQVHTHEVLARYTFGPRARRCWMLHAARSRSSTSPQRLAKQ